MRVLSCKVSERTPMKLQKGQSTESLGGSSAGESSSKKMQFTLHSFFGGSSSSQKRVAVDDLAVAEGLLRKRGRPNEATAALKQARAQGEKLIVATQAAFEAALKEARGEPCDNSNVAVGEIGGRALVMSLQKNAGGRPAGSNKVVAALDTKSNRKVSGEKRQRREENAVTKLDMCKALKKMQAASASIAEFHTTACRFYGLDWTQLKKIIKNEAHWVKRVKELKLGKGTAGTNEARGYNQKVVKRRKFGAGVRAAGAGRKDKFSHVKSRVKAWLWKERSLCHHVDKTDLVEEFMEQCTDEAEHCDMELRRRASKEETSRVPEAKNALVLACGDFVEKLQEGFEDMKTASEFAKKLSDAELQAWKCLLEDRVQKLKASQKYRETFGMSLLESTGSKLLKPGRMSTLPMEEEEARVRLGWQQMDRALWTAAFADAAELEKHVADGAAFVNCRTDCVIGFSDQIPVWVKIARGKQVYCEKELMQRLTSADFKKMQQERMLKLEQGPGEGKEAGDKEEFVVEMSDAVSEAKDGKLVQSRGTEDSTLRRTIGDASQEKFRITYEARHIILHYLKPGTEPKGVQWKGAIILKGVHARLHNISEGGEWLQTEEFSFAGKTYKREAGKSAGRV